MANYHNILIRMPNWLGDMVMSTPIIEDVKRLFPEAKITVMSLQSLSPLLFGNQNIDEIFTFSRPNEFLRRMGTRNVIFRVRQGKYDLGILLTNSFSSAFLFWKGRITERVGFANEWRRLFLTKTVPMPKMRGKEHLVTTYKRLLEPLGGRVTETAPELFVFPEEKHAVRDLLKKYGVPENHKIIGINPLAAYGEAKCWPKEKFRMLALKMAHESQLTLVFFGDTNGMALIKEICADLPSNVINLAGLTSLRELMAWISLCDLFLTNDSGPMHIAAALKTPLIAIFGSTNEVATGPYQHGVVIHKHVSCAPCYLRKCPIDFRCMNTIEVDEVISEIKKSLNLSERIRREELLSV